MFKIYFPLLFVISLNCFGQTTEMKDSLSENISDTSSDETSSYFQVGTGIGNEMYSAKNHALNAKQVSPTLVYTPTVGYYNKSGFNIVANSYVIRDPNRFGANQYSVTPGFETQDKSTWDFLISYTRYFVNNEYDIYSSPIQNDFYTSLVYKKNWLEPGIALGYSSGVSKEVIHFDTTINKIKRKLYDSVSNNLNLFTSILTVQHDFSWHKIFSRSDSLVFSPILMLNYESSNTTVDNNDNVAALLSSTLTKAQIKSTRTALTKKIRKLTKVQNTTFSLESASMDLQAAYTIGNFSIEPDIYFDYYLPQTTQKRFTQEFVVNFFYSL